MPEGDSIIVIWLKLLCLSGTVNDGGLIYLTRDVPYTDEMLSTQFDRPLQTIRLALKTFEHFGMIEVVENFLALPSWEKYQNVDGLDKIREQNRIRKQRQREAQTLLPCHVTVTGSHATDKDKDIEEERDIGAKSTRFTPPTLEEVTAYCKEKQNGVDPVAWWNFYDSKNWYIGKNKMSKWKSAIATWAQKNPQPVEQEKPKPKKYRPVVINGETVMEEYDE